MHAACRILAHFWLNEVRSADLPLLQALPEWWELLPAWDEAALVELAVAYQSLLGLTVPPYESIFLDPSAMLLAPATTRVQALYREGGWSPPQEARTAAPDHLGLELLALADWLEAGQSEIAARLVTGRLALWLPCFALTVRRVTPHPFYAHLNDLTLELALTLLGELGDGETPAPEFPRLPPPPHYAPSGMEPERRSAEDPGLRDVVRHLLTPREAGLFLSRADLGRLGRALQLPVGAGERFTMLTLLFQSAGQYDLVAELLARLDQRLEKAGAEYGQIADEHVVWRPYARLWQRRIADTRSLLAE